MKRVKKWRYYCEFCKKSGASGGHMARHEKSCTLNPDRVCRMCKAPLDGWREDQPEMVDMIKALDIAVIDKHEVEDSEVYTIKNEKEAVEALRDVANNCPACMLAALRQHGYPFLFDSFSFKDEKERFWSDVNESDRRDDCIDRVY